MGTLGSTQQETKKAARKVAGSVATAAASGFKVFRGDWGFRVKGLCRALNGFRVKGFRVEGCMV